MASQHTDNDGQPTVIKTGEFYCSRCNSRQTYELKATKPQAPNWFSRIFGAEGKGRYVECMNCGATAVPEVLQVADKSVDADYLKGIRRVAIQMMAVDGSIDDPEVEAIQEMYLQVTGHDLDDASIRREAERVSDHSVDELADFLSGLAVGMNDKGRELILKTAFWVVSADAKFEDSEATFLYRVGGALGVSAADVRVMIDRMS
jgi:uncharacterized tellurite resistance protein B-like protein